MKIDLLAFGAHPDDVELSCGGTLILHKKLGFTTGVVDFTRGELGTRGTVEQRNLEAVAAGKILGLDVRDNLDFKDGFFVNDEKHQLEIIRVLRKYRPEIVLGNAVYDRHPDHMRAASILEEAMFKSGLVKIVTTDSGKEQQPWRPKRLYHYIQSLSLTPDFLVDISEEMEQKMTAIRAYTTQFYDPSSNEPDTYISSPLFIKMLEARALEFGHRIQTTYAEGFITRQITGVKNLFHLR